MSFIDLLKKFSPLDEESAPALAPAAQPAPVVRTPAQLISEQPSAQVEELDASALIQPYITQREANYVAPRIQIPQEDNSENQERRKEFSSSLEKLREDYKAAQADASSRQQRAEMFAAIGNNLGNVIGGAQAMNTGASVTPPQLAKTEVKDYTSKVDKNYKTDYEGLIKQYKDLKGGGLTAKDKLYASIAQAQLDAGANRVNTNVNNIDRNAGIRGVAMQLKEQEKNELSSAEVDKDTEMETTLSEIDRVIANAANFKDKLGPNAEDYEAAKEGRFSSVVPGKIDPKYVAFRADSKALKGAYQKVISGLTVGVEEAKELNTYVPQVGQPYETFLANAQTFKRRVSEIRARTNSNLKTKQGKNVEGYKQPAPVSAGVMIQGPSGGPPKLVSAEFAEKYLKQPGYKKVD